MARVAADVDWTPVFSGPAVGVLALAWSASVFVYVERASEGLTPRRRSRASVVTGLAMIIAFMGLWVSTDAVVLRFEPEVLAPNQVVPPDEMLPSGLWQPPPLLWPVVLPDELGEDIDRAVAHYNGSFEDALHANREDWARRLETSHTGSLAGTRFLLLFVYIITSALIAIFSSLATGSRGFPRVEDKRGARPRPAESGRWGARSGRPPL